MAAPYLNLEEGILVVNIVIEGEPVSKQRPRMAFTRGGKVYTPKDTKRAQEVIGWAIRAKYRNLPLAGEYGVEAHFQTKNRQRRDLDNMVKLVLDACNGLVWQDDVQVVSLRASVVRGSTAPSTTLRIWRFPDSTPRIDCEVCGVSAKIYDSTSDRRFCSRSCANKAKRTGILVRCSCCGREIYRAPHRHGRQFYCSVECKVTDRTLELQCAHCGVCFRKPKSLVKHGRPFCGAACQEGYWRIHRAKSARGICSVCSGPTSDKRRTKCRPCHVAKGQAESPAMVEQKDTA